MKGDFGTKPYHPKEKCYGNTVFYKRLNKRVCSKGPDSGSRGSGGGGGHGGGSGGGCGGSGGSDGD